MAAPMRRPAGAITWLAVVALSLLACSDDDDVGVAARADSSTTTAATTDPDPAPTTTAAPTETTRPVEPATLSFHPVLEQQPPGVDTAPGTCGPDRVGQLAPDGTTALCFRLGPAVEGVGTVDATAHEGELGSWQIDVTLSDEGLANFNDMAARCFDAAPECPLHQLALVVDGQVLSAPTVNTPEFDERGITITGDFSAAEAQELAARLSVSAPD